MNVAVNGGPREVAEDDTVSSVVASLGQAARGRGLAVALNGEVLERSRWNTTRLEEGDRIEVLAAAQGG